MGPPPTTVDVWFYCFDKCAAGEANNAGAGAKKKNMKDFVPVRGKTSSVFTASLERDFHLGMLLICGKDLPDTHESPRTDLNCCGFMVLELTMPEQLPIQIYTHYPLTPVWLFPPFLWFVSLM